MMKHSWWEWSLREKITPPSTGPKGSLMTCENNNNNVSHKLWPLQSPDYNPIWHLWETLDQHIESTLHHHHTNAKSGNLMDLQMWRFVDSVSSQYMFRVFWVVVFLGVFLHFPLVFTLCLAFLSATWCWAGAVVWWILPKTVLWEQKSCRPDN